MTRTRTLVFGSLAALALGYGGYRLVKGTLLGRPGSPIKNRSATRLDLGPYPLEVSIPDPQDTGLAWYDPAATVKRAADENAKVPKLKAALHKEHKGDGPKAIEALLPKCKEPDSAQALLEVMNDSVPKTKSVGAMDGEAKPVGEPRPAEPPRIPGSGPVFTAEGAAGLHAVAKVAETLKARYGTKEMGHFDEPLLERAILLLGFHGAPERSGGPTVKTAAGKDVPGIDPVARATLRGMLQVEGSPQILAARALGQLGDMQTAKEIIENPGKYPGASIADFGAKAVEEFKQARLKQLKQGVEGFDNMVQGMRLTPKYQDVAIDLAMAGDAGAGMAMQRNFALELAQLDTDEVLARRIDRALRFPGTRAGTVARWGLEFGLLDPSFKKTIAMVLKAMEHDLRIVFETKNWTDDQLTVLNSATGMGMFGWIWHFLDIYRGRPAGDSWEPFYRQLEAVFRKHYRRATFPAFGSGRPVEDLSVFARHIGLPPIDWPDKRPWDLSRWESELRTAVRPGPDGKLRDEDMHFMYTPSVGQCFHAGHLKGREDF